MLYITLYNYYSSWLVVSTIVNNMKVNGKDDIPYIRENKSHVPNHQPDTYCGWASEILYQLIDGQHSIIYRVSTIQCEGFRNHPQYFRHENQFKVPENSQKDSGCPAFAKALRHETSAPRVPRGLAIQVWEQVRFSKVGTTRWAMG